VEVTILDCMHHYQSAVQGGSEWQSNEQSYLRPPPPAITHNRAPNTRIQYGQGDDLFYTPGHAGHLVSLSCYDVGLGTMHEGHHAHKQQWLSGKYTRSSSTSRSSDLSFPTSSYRFAAGHFNVW